jgi:hypothetical protein
LTVHTHNRSFPLKPIHTARYRGVHIHAGPAFGLPLSCDVTAAEAHEANDGLQRTETMLMAPTNRHERG